MYKIIIENLEFETIIGILDFERKKPQKILVNVKISYEGEFVDYAKVCEIIQKEMQKREFLLIEDALDFLADELKKIFSQIKEIYIQIKKLEILKNALVGVEILRKY